MIRPLLLATGLMLSLNAFAAVESNTSILGSSDVMHFNFKHLDKCLKMGWRAASPSEEQTTEAKSHIASARELWADQKMNLKKAKRALMEAWADYPISSQAVEDAERELYKDIKPIHTAFREARIKALNILSSDQKSEFNAAFKACHKKTAGETDQTVNRGERQEHETEAGAED